MSVAKFETGERFQSIDERSNPSSGTDFVRATFSHRGRKEERRYASLLPSWRLASNRNQVRRSVSSMKTSSRLAVPESS
jgi:hypothetical protein